MNGTITYHQQVSYCGKARCLKCREGTGHGPYWYAYQNVDGRTVRTYVGKNLPTEVQAEQQKQQLFETPSTEAESKAAIRIYTLGQFRIERLENNEWQPVTDPALRHQRVRSVLVCLLSSPGRMLGREQLIDALWPDIDVETGIERLHRSVHSLRQLLEPNIERPALSQLLQTEREQLQLADQSQLWIDADAFEQLLDRAHASSDAAETELLLERAVPLYSGDFLPDDLHEEWASARRQILLRKRIGLLLELADMRMQRGALTLAIELLDTLLGIDPCNEATVQRLLYLLAQLDRRSEAIRVYHRLEDALKLDFGIAPLAETQAMFEVIQQGGKPVIHSSTFVSRLPATTPLSHSIVQFGRTHQSKLVGRTTEQQTLLDLLSKVEQEVQFQPRGNGNGGQLRTTVIPSTAQRYPQCALLSGEAGIGKTRMAEELCRKAQQQGWTIAWSRVYAQESNIPYRIWIELLRKAMTNALWQKQEVQKQPRIYQALSTLLPELHDLLPEITQPSPVSPEQEQLRLWEATLYLLKSLSERTSLLLVLDDLHWADNSSDELLAYLVRRLHGYPILLVATYRDREISPQRPLYRLISELQKEQLATSLALPRLSDEQIEDLLSNVISTEINDTRIGMGERMGDSRVGASPTPTMDDADTFHGRGDREGRPGNDGHPGNGHPNGDRPGYGIIQQIQKQAAGNPLFAEELARVMPSSISTVEETSSDGIRQGPALPETITAVLELRLNTLSRECKQLLGRASVIGGSFSFNTLSLFEASQPNSDEDAMLEQLEEALHNGVLTEEGSGTRVTYHFWHPLFVSHLYESLSATRRSLLHRRVAGALQKEYQNRQEEGAASITHHLVKGGADPSQIALYAELAGNRAYKLSAFPEAERYYRLALQQREEATRLGMRDQALDDSLEERLHLAELLELIGECSMIQGNFVEARQLYERALALRSQPRPFNSIEEAQYEAQLQALLWCEIGWTGRYMGNKTLAHQCYEQGESILREIGIVEGPAWARIRFSQCSLNCQEGNFEEAYIAGQEALKLFENALQRPPLLIANFQHSTRARRTLQGDPVNLGRVYGLLGIIAATLGNTSDALNYLNTALATFEQYELHREIAITCCNLGNFHLRRAEQTLAQAFFSRSRILSERVGDIPSTAVIYWNLAELALRAGELTEAESWYKQSIILAEHINYFEYLSIWQSELSIVLIRQGKLSEAATCIQIAIRIAREIENTPCLGLALVGLGNLRIAQVKAEQADKDRRKTLLQKARRSLQRVVSLKEIDSETTARGRLALSETLLLLGDLTEAEQQIRVTIAEAQRTELHWIALQGQRLSGMILAAQGAYSEAIQQFEQLLPILLDGEMRLEHARVLQALGETLLQSRSSEELRFQQGMNYLQAAHKTFEECGAKLDMEATRRSIARYSVPAPKPRTIRITIQKRA